MELSQELLAKEPDAIGLKIGLKQRGCSGMSYVIEFAKQKAKFDEEVTQVFFFARFFIS